MHEGERESVPMERETELARPIESAWDRRMVRERLLAGGLSKLARGKESPKMGALPARGSVGDDTRG